MRKRPTLDWHSGALLCNDGDRLTVLPVTTTDALTLWIQPTAAGLGAGYTLVARHGDTQTPLAAVRTYSQAQRLLASARPRRTAWRPLPILTGIGAVSALLFMSWFLFVLPSVPPPGLAPARTATRLFAPSSTPERPTTPALHEVRQPAAVADPATRARTNTVAASSASPASPATPATPASPASPTPAANPFGLSRSP